MNITIDQAEGKVPVTIMRLQGDLDGSNYLDVIDRARELCGAGTQFILLDMSEVPFMASSGLVALHSVALLMRGDEPPDPEYGWEAFHTLDRDRESGFQEQVKLLNPQPRVQRSLEVTGMTEFFVIHNDLDTAIASFS